MRIIVLKILLFIVLTFIYCFLGFITFAMVFQLDEGTAGGVIAEVLASLYYVFRFPIQTIIFDVFKSPYGFPYSFFFYTLFANGLLQAYLTQLAISFYKNRRSRQLSGDREHVPR